MTHLGPYELNCVHLGDCIELMKALPDKCIDLVATDPPYGVELDYGNGYDDSFESWKILIDNTLDEMIRVSSGAVLVPTSKIEGEAYLYTKNPKWRIAWHKGATSTRCAIGFKDWETVFVFGSKFPKQLHDYFKITPEHKDSIARTHPCPKPVRFSKWLIDKFSKEGDLIFDPFSGSGTTGVAAIQTGRQFLGFEIDPRWCDLANKRIESAKAQGVLAL